MVGELWVDVLRATLDVGLARRSWTDYIDISIGGTLPNDGISSQTSRFGPQISNVLQLQIVTGSCEINLEYLTANFDLSSFIKSVLDPSLINKDVTFKNIS